MFDTKQRAYQWNVMDRMKNMYMLLLMLAFSSTIAQAQQPTQSPKPNTQSTVAENYKVCVLGAVIKPSEIHFKDSLTVTQAIKAVGGISPANKNIEVRVYSQMTQGKGITRVIYLDLKDIEKKKYKDLELQDYDIVEVLPKKRGKRIPKQNVNPCPSMIPNSILPGSIM